MTTPAYVAVDWGTSSFRLWLMASDGTVIAERRSGEGMTTAATAGFAKVLDAHLDAAGAPSGLPVIICGMAGARQGWTEAGYIDTPAALASIPAAAVSVPGTSADIRILPGLAQRGASPDVMRGEETQLLGALDGLGGGRHLVCMPGTHSKWVRVEGDSVSGFSTFMTGEIFDALSKHTILSHSVADGGAVDGTGSAFRDAVSAVRADPALFTSRLFAVRAGQLLDKLANADAKARLSGTLIGVELAGALGTMPAGTPIALVASGSLGALYESAFEVFGIKPAIIDADQAVRIGLAAAARSIWSI
ncbi:2-dehydro-3-deoxygalactonokinase [Sinorhizobium sp. BG8]|uniref:2-dehydro-3-deoxygalactonokinase n=1 Tax=Sinorhizobium sp. BG8 TaxID=2613773 RepID=UPI00193E5E08|nr:2-dehydro-3-deoxygalactonokinase [Sinorhizobium sp. BG8]QRM54490.1 2-dehydro-3-deoxygalactonokinase [Sinorhizobium sp. BG8]